MTKATELTDDGLLGRMIAGDEEAFTLLYRRRQPAIYRFVLHMSGRPAVAEDVTQEVFMTLIRDAKRFDPARGTLNGFLFGIARNHMRKRWEQERRLVPLADDAEERGELAASGSAGTDEFSVRETVFRVRHAIATLPENYREVVVLCDLEEMSYDEAASALGSPVGTVRSRLHRARAMLLEKLRGLSAAGRTPVAGR
jgi:RNA polymerase sigma-70 factor, ECF subfamily